MFCNVGDPFSSRFGHAPRTRIAPPKNLRPSFSFFFAMSTHMCFALVVIGVFATGLGALTSAAPAISWTVATQSWGVPQTLYPTLAGNAVVYAGDTKYGYVSALSGVARWNISYVNQNTQTEGPFAFASSTVLGAIAPNSGTVATLWVINAINGNITTSLFDDGSLDQQSIVSVGGAFYTGSITSESLTKVFANGTVAWKASLNDLILALVPSRNSVFVTYGTSIAKFLQNGTRAWVQVLDDVQPFGLAYDITTGTVLVTATTDETGSALGFTFARAFNGQTGATIWSQNFTQIFNATIVGNAGVFILTTATSITAVNAVGGAVRWSKTAFSFAGTTVPGVVMGGTFLITSLSGNDVTKLSLRTGSKKSSFNLPTGTTIALPPTLLARGTLAVVAATTTASTGATLYAVSGL